MSNLAEITKRVETLNAKVKSLTYERMRQLAEVEQAEKKYKEGIVNYNAKYNTNITPENIQAEYDRVRSELEKQAEALENQIKYIESGEYKSKPATPTNVTVTGTDGNKVEAQVEAPVFNNSSGVNVPSSDFKNVAPAPAPAPVAPTATAPTLADINPVANNAPVAPVPVAPAPTPTPAPAPAPVVPAPVAPTPAPASTISTGFGFTNAPAPNPMVNTAAAPTPPPAPTGFSNGFASASTGFGGGFTNNVQSFSGFGGQSAPAPAPNPAPSVAPPNGFSAPQSAADANSQLAGILNKL